MILYNSVMHAETVSYSAARQNLAKLMNTCVEDSQPILIKGRKASVVMVPYDDWRAEQETSHILSDPELASHVREGLAQAQRGETIPMTLEQLDAFLGIKDEA